MCVLALTLWQHTTVTKECRRQTPVPKDVHPVTPGPDVPAAVARFAGAWSGVWRPAGAVAVSFAFRHLLRGQSFDPPCQTLIVEEVRANGYVRLIVSSAASATLEVPLPEVFRVTGRIVDSALQFQLPVPGARPAFTYRLVKEGLDGVITLSGNEISGLHLRRVNDLTDWPCEARDAAALAAPSTDSARSHLTAEDLIQDGSPQPRLVHNAYFLPVGQHAPARHLFKGMLKVDSTPLLRARYGCSGLVETFPAFSATFFTHGEYLVPVVRDVLHPPATLMLSPGRVWSEPGDRGMSRASFPFVLTSTWSNETHNGVATFLYDETHVSALQFQIVQEAAAAKYDGWGRALMSYLPGSVPNEAALHEQFATELRDQIPVQPWSALYAGAGAHWLEQFDGDALPEDVSVSGVVMDGAVYLHRCETRYGPYPYCREMRHGVFSVTKSLGAAVTLLRLAQKYGEQVFDLKIKDYVPVTATHNGWENVTFGDVLNMATGVGDRAPEREPNNSGADENQAKTYQWSMAQTAKAKLDISFSYGKYAWGPGQVFRYNSTQTFVLAVAMESFLKRQEGPQAQLWEMMVNEVFHPIGIAHLPTMHTIEPGGARGIPILAVGLYPTIDDIAKLTLLLQNGGRYQSQQLLHAGKLAEALYKTDLVGLPSGYENRFGTGRYHMSFIGIPFRTDDGCFFQIPYMNGIGGNLVTLLPNSIATFRFADGDTYDVDTMVLAGAALRPFPCSSAPVELPRKREPLRASDVHAAFTGNTLYADTWLGGAPDARFMLFLAADGMWYGTLDGGPEAGTWRISPAGQLCRKDWHERRERCAEVYQDRERFELYPIDGFEKWIFRRVLGATQRTVR